MSNIDKQALREEFQLMQDHYSDPADRERQVIYIAAEALLDELEAAEKCIVELDTRTLTVKLPADYRNDDGSINDDMFNTCAVVGAFREALRAAGIGVKGE